MQIVSIIPITHGARTDTLTYYTSRLLGRGALVTVPVRGKATPGIVADVRDLPEEKSALKSQSYSLQPISRVRHSAFLGEQHFSAIRTIADYFAAPLGAVIADLFPAAVLTDAAAVRAPSLPHVRERTTPPTLIQAPFGERIQQYRAAIRSAFAGGTSVMMLLPSVHEIDMLAPELKKGIEQYTYLLHGELSKSAQRDGWRSVLVSEHPVLILVTRTFLTIPRHDIAFLVIEHESSPAYIGQKRPHIDMLVAGTIMTEALGWQLIIGDTIIRTATAHRASNAPLLGTRTVSPSRILSNADQLVVPIRRDARERGVSEELFQLVSYAQAEGDQTLVFLNRRGHTTTLICRDCGERLTCPACGNALVLHRSHADRSGARESRDITLLCHGCLREETFGGRCPHCRSWNLYGYGTGIEKVAEALAPIVPEHRRFILDRDHAEDAVRAHEIARAFRKTPGGVLLSTELIFSHFAPETPVDHVAVASVDTLLALPNFRIREKVFRILVELRLMATKTFLVQTHEPELLLFTYALRGNVSSFYREELEYRKALGYPPFTTLIRISKTGRPARAVEEVVRGLADALAPWRPHVHGALENSRLGPATWHILLRLEPKSWPDEERKLLGILRSLTPDWEIMINPDTLV